jgi:hypothetical protein
VINYVMSSGNSSACTHCNKGKGVPLHAMEALEGRGSIAPTHSRPQH